jgi:hypothetical protein
MKLDTIIAALDQLKGHLMPMNTEGKRLQVLRLYRAVRKYHPWGFHLSPGTGQPYAARRKKNGSMAFLFTSCTIPEHRLRIVDEHQEHPQQVAA